MWCPFQWTQGLCFWFVSFVCLFCFITFCLVFVSSVSFLNWIAGMAKATDVTRAAKAILTCMLSTQMVFFTDECGLLLVPRWRDFISICLEFTFFLICTVQTYSPMSFYKASAAKLMEKEINYEISKPTQSTVSCMIICDLLKYSALAEFKSCDSDSLRSQASK